MDLHGEIMNIQVDEDQETQSIKDALKKWDLSTDIWREIYRAGHRDARHKAAELATANQEGD